MFLVRESQVTVHSSPTALKMSLVNCSRPLNFFSLSRCSALSNPLRDSRVAKTVVKRVRSEFDCEEFDSSPLVLFLFLELIETIFT